MPGWRKSLLIAALAGLLAAYWIAWRAPAVGIFHDDGVYLVTAKALAEGKGYRIISLPQEIPQTKYPILFPLLLAGVWKVFPEFPANVPLLKLVPLLSTAIWLWLIYKLLLEEGARPDAAAWISFLTGASTWVVFLGAMVLSESTFAALTAAALLSLRRFEKRQDLGWLAAGVVLAALAFHTRTLGIALVGATPLYFAYRRQWRVAIAFGAGAALLCAPWLLWVATHSGAAAAAAPTATDAYYSQENYQSWNILKSFTPSQKLHIVALNVFYLIFSPSIILGIPSSGVFLVVGLVFGAWCYWSAARSGISLLTVYLGCYLGLVVAWAWVPSRFLVPLFPILLWLAWSQLSLKGRARTALMVVLTAANVSFLVAGLARTVRLGHPLSTSLKENDTWAGMVALLEQVRRQTPANAVLVGNLDPLYYLYTGRKAIRGFAAEPYQLLYAHEGEPLGTAAAFLDNARRQGATYYLESPNSAFAEGPYLERMMMSIQAGEPGSMSKVQPSVGEGFGLWQLHPGASPGLKQVMGKNVPPD